MGERLSAEQRRSLSGEFEKIDLQDRYVAYAIIDKKLSDEDFEVLISPAGTKERVVLRQLRSHSLSDSDFVKELISPMLKKNHLEKPAVKKLLHEGAVKRVKADQFLGGAQLVLLRCYVENAFGAAVDALKVEELFNLIRTLKVERETNEEFKPFWDELDEEERELFKGVLEADRDNVRKELEEFESEGIKVEHIIDDLKGILEGLKGEDKEAHRSVRRQARLIGEKQKELGDFYLEVLGTLNAIERADLPGKVKLDAVAGSMIDWAYRLGVKEDAVLGTLTEIQEGIDKKQAPEKMTMDNLSSTLRQEMLRGVMHNFDLLAKYGYEEVLDTSQRMEQFKQFFDAAKRIPEDVIKAEIWNLKRTEDSKKFFKSMGREY